MASSASQSDVSSVMQMCNCSKREAIELLKHSGNDPQRAQLRHQMKLQFGWTPSVQQPHRITEPAANLHPPRPRNNQRVGNTPDNDDYDIITEQSDREVFINRPKPTPPEMQRPMTLTSGSKHTTHRNYDKDTSWNSASPIGVPYEASVPNDLPHASWKEFSSKTTIPSSSVPTMMNDETNDPRHNGASTSAEKKDPSTIVDANNQGEERPSSAHVPEIHIDDRDSAASDQLEWDFMLPKISSRSIAASGRGLQRFDIREMVAIIQDRPNEQFVSNHFDAFDATTIRSYINQEIEGFQSIFYAVATNNDRIIRTWIEHGANVNAVHQRTGIPLLAFAIVHGETIAEDTTEVVATLLSKGASPFAIATPFWKPYDRDLDENGPNQEELELCDQQQTKWLCQSAKKKLARNLNLTHRYYLDRASRTPKPSARQQQVAERHKAQGLLGLPYFLIGQSLAASRLLQTCVNHLADRKDRPKPLVMVFAGPSGHGKTELARRLGYLMSLDLEVVDCTIVNREIELFGGRHPFVNAGEGTPLNNFLARNAGQRCIVFMDEFEKTTKEIWQALLLPFDNGEYQDRRNLQRIDCSKTIWILATNALDKRIRDFCKINEAILFNDDESSIDDRNQLMKQLDKNLRNDFLAKFDAPITGRISAFLPFLLFSRPEQSVIAHKYLLELGREIRRPVNLTVGSEERLIGNVRLRIRRDALLCSTIAEEGYHPDLGARSLITTVDSVRNMVIDAYLEVDEAIREAEQLVDFAVDVRKGNIFVDRWEEDAHTEEEHLKA